MPRPRKYRKVCSLPRSTHFVPLNYLDDPAIVMTVDEYETIRLIDLEKMTQLQCAEQMEIARTTVQSIYYSARRKLAECIVQGKQMVIAGGDIRICENHNFNCRKCNRWCCDNIECLTKNVEDVITDTITRLTFP